MSAELERLLERRATPRTDTITPSPGTHPAPFPENSVNGVPFPGYDELTVSQVLLRLDELDLPELRGVLECERGHANRKSVLDALLVNRLGDWFDRCDGHRRRRPAPTADTRALGG